MNRRPLLDIKAAIVTSSAASNVENGKATGTFSYTYELIAKAGRLNITYLGDPTFGSCQKDGTYDGIYGMIQKSIVDTSAGPVPIKLLSTDCEVPIIPGALVVQQDLHIGSFREPGKETAKDVFDSIYIVEPSVVALYAFLTIAVLIALSRQGLARNSRSLRPLQLLWQFTCVLLKQNVDYGSLATRTAQVTLLIFVCGVTWLIVFYNCLFGTNLTVKEPDHTVNNLKQLLMSTKLPTFEATSAQSLFQHAEQGSLQEKIWNKALKMLKDRKNIPYSSGSIEDILLGNNDYMQVTNLMAKSGSCGSRCNLALVSALMPIEISRSFACGTEVLKGDKNPDKKQAYKFYVSKGFMSDMTGSAMSPNSSHEMRNRIYGSFLAVAESGFFVEIHKTAAARMVTILGENIFLVECLAGINKGDDSEAQDSSLRYGDIVKLVKIFFYSCIAAVVVLYCEKLSNRYPPTYNRRRVVIRHITFTKGRWV